MRYEPQTTLKIDLKVKLVKVIYTFTIHWLCLSIMHICVTQKTTSFQKKYTRSFFRHFTFIF